MTLRDDFIRDMNDLQSKHDDTRATIQKMIDIGFDASAKIFEQYAALLDTAARQLAIRYGIDPIVMAWQIRENDWGRKALTCYYTADTTEYPITDAGTFFDFEHGYPAQPTTNI